MASLPTFTSYASAVVPTSGVAYTIGTADAVYVRATCTAMTLTLPTGGTVDCGAVVIGTIIPIPSVSATFSGGSLIAMKVQ